MLLRTMWKFEEVLIELDLTKVIIRPESEKDYQVIKEINDAAFNQNNESLLIEQLRESPDFIPDLSLVAEMEGKIAGHILFYPVKINDGNAEYITLSLAPMAVHPDYQRKGVGGKLITEGKRRAKAMRYDSIIVIGHPEYYPKFGFEKASCFNIRPPFDIPEVAFLALELNEGALKNIRGFVEYPQPYYNAL